MRSCKGPPPPRFANLPGRAGGRVSLGRGAGPTGADELANAYSALFVRALPVLNAILMPIVMALIASRLWDMEIKGQHHKTAVHAAKPPQSVCGQGSAGHGRGPADGHAGNGRIHPAGAGAGGYTEAFPAGPFVYTGICTLAVDVMLFFSELLLMLIFDNPLPALCVGIVGALIGLFSAFMPPLVSYFVPWGYFVPLSCYEGFLLGPGHPHCDLRPAALQLGTAGVYRGTGSGFVCRRLAHDAR